MSYDALLSEHRRLVILRVLAEAPGYMANDSVLQTALGRFGFPVSRDQVKTEIAWLRDQQLVTSDKVESVTVATITQRGLDVAGGQVGVPGVKKPGPGA